MKRLGVTGCTVGPQTVNNFSFSASTTGSATAVPDTSIFVTPAFGTNLYGLIFSTTGDFTVTTGSVTYLLGFTWDSLPIRGMDDVLDPGNPSIFTDGCVGAAFTPTCAGTPVSVTVNPTQLTDSTFFADTAILGIANTITMSATSSFTTLENDVFVSPEPASFLLAGLGLSMLAYFERRLRSHFKRGAKDGRHARREHRERFMIGLDRVPIIAVAFVGQGQRVQNIGIGFVGHGDRFARICSERLASSRNSANGVVDNNCA